MEKIQIFQHTLTEATNKMTKAALLLDRLSERCNDQAFAIANNFSDDEIRKAETQNASKLLYELDQTLSFISGALASHAEFIEEFARTQEPIREGA